MKTIYSIGRDPGCDIYLYDDKNVISRNHAVLKVGKGGKYFISDQSMNGTYINGIKVAPGVQVPVTRKDVVTFAHVAELDWSLIPNSGIRTLKTVLLSTLAVLLIAGAAWGVVKYLEALKTPSQTINSIPSGTVVVEDEEEQKKEEAKKQELLEWEKKVRAAEQKKKEKAKKAQETQDVKEVKDKAEPDESKAEENINVDPII